MDGPSYKFVGNWGWQAKQAILQARWWWERHAGYDLASFHADHTICCLCQQLVRSGCLLAWQTARRFSPSLTDIHSTYSGLPPALCFNII